MFYLLFSLLLGGVGSGWAQQLHVGAKSNKGILHLEGGIDVPVSVGRAWNFLTNYDHLSAYIPDLDSSKVVASTDSSLLVSQVLTTRLVLPWTFRFVLNIVEREPVFDFEMVEGNLRLYQGQWAVRAKGQGARVEYRAEAGHGLRVPAFILRYIARRQTRKMLQAIGSELGRRSEEED